ncbi:ferric reductase-like transmembrane domain-containing protein [Nocardioides taihuensis]|uniref:Ferric reductase-like transmembrane domain-containing protein n=1 Tax=Nocardioides taihuensis TaxID=1835606 RepID=A0ABW0BMD4_9ACTN
MTDGPLLWYLNRGTGVVVLVLLTLTTVLGIASIGGRPARGIPRFVTQSLHRNAALLAVVLLAGHVASAVVDTYVDIRWWQAFWPFGATYQPLWLGLGAVALDLMLVIVVTSMLRTHMSHRGWRLLHLASYPLWVISLAHGIGIGTDLGGAWWAAAVGCAAAVGAAAAWRLVRLVLDRPWRQPEPDLSDTRPLGVLR